MSWRSQILTSVPEVIIVYTKEIIVLIILKKTVRAPCFRNPVQYSKLTVISKIFSCVLRTNAADVQRASSDGSLLSAVVGHKNMTMVASWLNSGVMDWNKS